ncbi:TetR/AcrR family transcriptional regulator [Modestobacter roseus]|uniref:TetR family transcriptional regulator n=1 Tax=Modestobacter roseus TaxID=1181884 RepID=A0A562ILV6_9ACTN|nr:TetR/AcrR family transcriptional regulator [Modestobacter roseus]MQA34285.1 TetR family transcriptional regulator [Modestobacter roseus]TWH71878.1 TetR family transcriptional regulator [Modestobacter roseus]
MTDVRPGAGRTPSRAVEQALVDAAERVLVRDGLGAVTVRAVATEAGVAPMGVYNRFGSKDGLIAAVLVRGFDGLRGAVTADDDADPLARLLASGRNYRLFALDRPQHYGAMFGGRPLPTEGADELVAAATAAFEALVGHVRYAMARGALRDGDPVEAAQVIWSSVHGAVSLELGGAVLTPDPSATYETLLRMLLAGLA